jgi:hypothetical protein
VLAVHATCLFQPPSLSRLRQRQLTTVYCQSFMGARNRRHLKSPPLPRNWMDLSWVSSDVASKQIAAKPSLAYPTVVERVPKTVPARIRLLPALSAAEVGCAVKVCVYCEFGACTDGFALFIVNVSFLSLSPVYSNLHFQLL